MGRFIEHTTVYGTDLSDDESAEAMTKIVVNLPAEVIIQGVSRIHEEFTKFFYANYFKESLEEKDCPLAVQHGIHG